MATVAFIPLPKVIVDGHDLSRLYKSATIHTDPGKVPTINLELIGTTEIDKDGNITVKPL